MGELNKKFERPKRGESSLTMQPLDFRPDNLLCCPERPGSARSGQSRIITQYAPFDNVDVNQDKWSDSEEMSWQLPLRCATGQWRTF